MLCVTTLAGLFNGLLIVTFSLPSMAVTLGMMGVYRAIALFIGGHEGFGANAFQKSYVWIGSQSIPAASPSRSSCWWLLFVLAYLLVHRSVYGRLLFATGNNRKATYLSGHNVKAIIVSTYGMPACWRVSPPSSSSGSTNPPGRTISPKSSSSWLPASPSGASASPAGKGTSWGWFSPSCCSAPSRTGWDWPTSTDRSRRWSSG